MREIFCKDLDDYIEKAYEYSEKFGGTVLSANSPKELILGLLIGDVFFRLRLSRAKRGKHELHTILFKLKISIEDYINKKLKNKVKTLMLFM